MDASSDKEGPRRGVALLIAVAAVVIMMGFMSDLLILSAVQLESSRSVRDRVRSEYLLKSGFNLALFGLSIDWGLDILRATQLKDQPGLGRPPVDSGNDIWAILSEAVTQVTPIGADLTAWVDAAKAESRASTKEDEKDKFNLGSIFNEKVKTGMELFEDAFYFDIVDEGARINLNNFYSGRPEFTLQSLKALFSCPVEQEYFELKEIDSEALVYRIKDYIDKDSRAQSESGYSDENDPYSKQNRKAKNAPLDSVDELLMIDGWDADLHAVFKKYLTVFPIVRKKNEQTRTNFNTMSDAMKFCMAPSLLTEGCRGKIGFGQEDAEPVEFDRKSIKSQLGKQCTRSDSLNKAVDFSVSSRVFRFNVAATTGDQERRLRVVVRRVEPKEKIAMREQHKIKRSYRVLYWRVD